ncbi:uncharacterized protein L199_005034 [Kwoniella botswanensis]|uniref:uncharacterized protein n=1 Tax=Kwoniella botswanensis TaxID=1268659 RepID=UPI00315CC948
MSCSSVSRKLIAFGNNVCGNLDPTCSSIIQRASDVTTHCDCDDINWSSWTCTIGGDDVDPLKIWGNDPLVIDDQPTKIDFSGRVIGFERPLAFLLEDGFVESTEKKRSSTTWDQVVSTGLGLTYACKDDQIYRFDDLEHLMRNDPSFGPIHGLPPGALQLYATESRAFALVDGQTQHLYEMIDVKSLPPKLVKTSDQVQLDHIDDLEASGNLTVIAGSGNQVGVVTEVGVAYLLPSKGDIEMISFDDEEIRLMGLGADFEIVVTDQNIYVRGSSK